MGQVRKALPKPAAKANELNVVQIPNDRQSAAKFTVDRYIELFDGIAQDFGGAVNLSSLQRHLIHTTAQMLVRAQDQAAKYAENPDASDVREHVMLVNALARCLQLLGVSLKKPEPKQIPDLEEYLAQQAAQDDPDQEAEMPGPLPN